MEQYLIDTNAVSQYLTEDFPSAGMDFLDNIMNYVPNISVITQIESLSWKTTEKVETIIKSFISDSNIIDLDSEIVAQCIDLRRKRNIKTPDSIIAATAIANKYILITGNEKDFLNIKGLKIVNPHKL